MPGATALDYVETSDGEVDVIAMEGEPGRGRTDTIVETVGGREFQLDRAGFWQVHRQAPAVLTEAVRRAIDVDAIDTAGWSLDLYGGVGLFAATIAEALGGHCRRLRRTEVGPFRVEDADEERIVPTELALALLP